MAVNLWAVRGAKHRHLRIWVPLMHFYYPLGCLAGWKAIYEVVVNPFYWDKTAHGVFDEAEDAGAQLPLTAGFATVPLLGQIDSTHVAAQPRAEAAAFAPINAAAISATAASIAPASALNPGDIEGAPLRQSG